MEDERPARQKIIASVLTLVRRFLAMSPESTSNPLVCGAQFGQSTVLQYPNTPVLQYSNTPLLHYSTAPAHDH